MNIKSLLYENGGTNNYYLILGLLLLSIGIYNIISYGTSTFTASVSVYPFLILGTLYFTKIKHNVDIIIELILLVAVFATSIVGEFSGVSLLVILLFQVKENKKQIIFIIGLLVIGITINTIKFEHTTPQLFKSLFLVSLFLVKFYYKMYLPKKRLRQRVKYLENQLSIFGTRKKLTDDQILLKYNFLIHSGDNKYRKLQDLRLLVNKDIKEIAFINGVSSNTINREFDNIKKNIGIELGKDIFLLRDLIKSCIELGIIEVNFIQH